jgi:hypothetical protein
MTLIQLESCCLNRLLIDYPLHGIVEMDPCVEIQKTVCSFVIPNDLKRDGCHGCIMQLVTENISNQILKHVVRDITTMLLSENRIVDKRLTLCYNALDSSSISDILLFRYTLVWV